MIRIDACGSSTDHTSASCALSKLISSEPQARDRWKPLRTWIPMLVLPLMLAMRFVPGLVPNGPSKTWMASAFGPFLVGLLVVLWWLLASRARWFERGLGVIGLAAAVGVEQVLCHHSMRGPLLIVMTLPMAIAGFAFGTILFGKRLSIQRTWWAIALAALACVFSLFVCTDGLWGDFSFGFEWRWKPTSEERAMAYRKEAAASMLRDAVVPSAGKLESLPSQWPAFRGPGRDGRQTGVVFRDDWQSTPPEELWRIPVGPAWSSFVVAGDRLFTQEQRGENEAVVCYDATDGSQIWEFTHPSRFFESLGGLGPRATPTLSEGSLYALGAEGSPVRLGMTDGKKIWEVDLKQAAGRNEPPMWGFSSSPCVEQGLVIVHAGGAGDLGVKDMKPDFNDLLIQDGYLYGFDNAIFACVDLKDGVRK